MTSKIVKRKLPAWRTQSKSIQKFQFMFHFIPRSDTNKRASLLSHKSLIIYCLSLVMLFLLVRLGGKLIPGVLGYASDMSVMDLLVYTNAQRASSGIAPLYLNKQLTAAAKQKALYMFRHNYWAHVAPDGTEPWAFILAQDYDYTYAGENLAKNFSQSKDVVDAWYASPSHKENLMSPNYDEIGFAIVNGTLEGYETTLVVQLFGRPRDKSKVSTPLTENELLLAEDKIWLYDGSAELKEYTAINPQKSVAGSSAALPDTHVQTTPMVAIHSSVKYLYVGLAGFLIGLLGLDIVYSRRNSIDHRGGHSLAHIAMLLIAVMGILFIINPGRII